MRRTTTAVALTITAALFAASAQAKEPRESIATERTAVYLRNHTQLPITIGTYFKYNEKHKPGGLLSGNSAYGKNGDYWGHGVTSIGPGNMRKFWTFDDFQDIVDYRHTKFRLPVTINGQTSTLAYVYMNVDAGIASYQLSCTQGSSWTTGVQSDSFTHKGKKFKIHGAKNADGEIFFTIADPSGNGGFTPKNASSKDELTVINYNTFLLIGPTTAIDFIGVKPSFCARAAEMPTHIPKVDVLILNEMCSKAYCDVDAKNLPDKLIAKGYYKYKSKAHNRGPLTAGASAPLSNGGLIVLSRYPIQDIYEGTFTKGESGMPKGFLITKITKSGQDYYVVGTHTNSGHGGTATRAEQFKEIATAVEMRVPKGARVIIGGDYNVYDSEINSVKGILKGEESGFNSIIPGSYSFYGNYYTDDKSEDNKKFDWILHHGVKPKKMDWRYVALRSMADSIQPYCDLSDHYAVYAHLDYRGTTDNSLAIAEATRAAARAVAAAAATAVNKHPPAQYKVKGSKTIFRHTGKGKWEEYDGKKVKFRFDEYKRDKDYIYINDAKRKMAFRIIPDKPGQMQWDVDGKWKDLYETTPVTAIQTQTKPQLR